MQLVEQGLIALSDPVAKYIPEFAKLGVFVAGGGNVPFVSRPPSAPLRVIDLMRHTSGFTYSFQERSNIDAAYRKTELESWSKNDSASFIEHLSRIPLEFDPGTCWNYSVSTDIVGVIVERVSGKSLGTYFSDHIFKPLGMVDTGFWTPPEKASRVVAIHTYDSAGKIKGPDQNKVTTAKPSFLGASGGLSSTAEDYWRFAQAMLNGGELGGRKDLLLDAELAHGLPGRHRLLGDRRRGVGHRDAAVEHHDAMQRQTQFVARRVHTLRCAAVVDRALSRYETLTPALDDRQKRRAESRQHAEPAKVADAKHSDTTLFP